MRQGMLVTGDGGREYWLLVMRAGNTGYLMCFVMDIFRMLWMFFVTH